MSNKDKTVTLEEVEAAMEHIIHKDTADSIIEFLSRPAVEFQEEEVYKLATKKPVTIAFIEWTGENLLDVIRFTGQHASAMSYKWEEYEDLVREKGLKIYTLEGSHMASIGDMIIKGVKGEHYPCKPDIFAATYEIEPSANGDRSEANEQT